MTRIRISIRIRILVTVGYDGADDLHSVSFSLLGLSRRFGNKEQQEAANVKYGVVWGLERIK